MSKEEKSLFDEIWAAAGLSKEEPPAEQPQEIKEPAEIAEEIAPVEAPVAEPIAAPAEKPVEPPNEAPAEEAAKAPVEAPAEAPKEEKTTGPNEHTVKKKSVRFLVVYTVAFVLVVAALISGSYMISSRLQQEMAEGNESLGSSQSKLQNIQDKNAALKKENAAVKEENELLTASQADADALIAGAGDMVEHNEYLAAAMNAYIRGSRTTARTILSTIDREKLSPTFQEYYDSLDTRLN